MFGFFSLVSVFAFFVFVWVRVSYFYSRLFLWFFWFFSQLVVPLLVPISCQLAVTVEPLLFGVVNDFVWMTGDGHRQLTRCYPLWPVVTRCDRCGLVPWFLFGAVWIYNGKWSLCVIHLFFFLFFFFFFFFFFLFFFVFFCCLSVLIFDWLLVMSGFLKGRLLADAFSYWFMAFGRHIDAVISWSFLVTRFRCPVGTVTHFDWCRSIRSLWPLGVKLVKVWIAID